MSGSAAHFRSWLIRYAAARRALGRDLTDEEYRRYVERS